MKRSLWQQRERVRRKMKEEKKGMEGGVRLQDRVRKKKKERKKYSQKDLLKRA